MIRIGLFACAALGLFSAAFAHPASAQRSCEAFSGLKLPSTIVTLAQTVSAGEFAPPPPVVGPGGLADLSGRGPGGRGPAEAAPPSAPGNSINYYESVVQK